MATIGPLPLNKGWMTDVDSFTCPPGGAKTFYGFQPYGSGAIKTLDGLSNFAMAQITGGKSPQGFTIWQDPAQIGSQYPIVAVPSNSKIYTSIGPTFSSWTDRTGAVTVAGDGVYTFDVLNGKLLLFNSSSTLAVVPLVITTYNGNAAVLGGTPPIGNIVKVCNNMAFVSQVLASNATQSAIYWSAASDPTTWPAGSNVTFRQGDGDYITALSAIGSNLFIFKAHSIGILNTNSTTISGTVTLGPLTTFTDRIGCVGHQAVDTMPDGSIVFLGLDRNIYQTDGSTIVCLSNNPAPISNINPGVNFPSGGTNAPLIYSPTGFTFSALRVDPMFHRIMVLMYAATGAVNKIYSFDYLYRTWADWTELNNDTGVGNYGFINCLEVMPNQMANSTGLGNSAWIGFSNGYLFTSNPIVFLQHPSLSAWTNTLETSIQLGSSSPPGFIPRSLLIPISFPYSSGTVPGIITVTLGFDGTYAGSAAYTSGSITAPPNNILIRVPVGEFLRSTFVHPITLDIKIQIKGNATLDQMIVEPIYISDEVI